MCKRSDRVHDIEWRLTHNATQDKARKKLRVELMDALIDLCDVRATALGESILNVERALNDRHTARP